MRGMCLCGHVRGAHVGDATSCGMCKCSGFADKDAKEAIDSVRMRVNAMETKLDAIGRRLDALQDRLRS